MATGKSGAGKAGVGVGGAVGWLLLAVAGAALAMTSYVLLSDADDGAANWWLAVAAPQKLGQQLARSAGAAVAGEGGAFVRLRGERDQLQSAMVALDA
ncbi:MAG TPA: hypothetical protein VES73_12760, partial [Lamprocystis sp. (in: g-proteobacteria)]|nr:hypothetical protein [Lamprocystis sp. (in: g-proteobacteria)]